MYDVIIIGGGPVGLFLGLSLARQDIEVLVLEAEADIVPSPRALMYFPIVLHEFEKSGILDDVVEAGYKNQEGLCFRTPFGGTNEVLAKIPPGEASDGEIDYGVQLAQPEMAGIIRNHALKCPTFTIKYNTRFVDMKEQNDTVIVEAQPHIGENLFYAAQFLVACDGASSSVRKRLDIPFEGLTWDDWRFLAINIKYDFAKYGYPAANHVIDPEDWAVIVRASNEKEGPWRIATGIDPKIPKLLPGPRPLKYDVVAVNPYWAHEHVAKTFTSGRVFLCRDDAHVCNPLTALGLTTGLIDVAYLSRLLPQAFSTHSPRPWQALLQQYATLRRKDVINRVHKQTIEGKMRIHSLDRKVVAQRDDFFNMLNKNPGFGRFIASTMIEKVPDSLFPSLATRSMNALAGVLKFCRIVPMIIYWKLRSSIL
ncbi:hypothetical protein HBH69_061680 [Parastagonospora nodorum]|nr:hypothetical protein HBH43_039610 [Parastagonospora nodorum]KAH4238333.1 hypothetical protein HBI06_038400 [Parastagonospora nodorum]KAH4239028.1 hypothetical protein HBI05_121380 [Parastagonospora nodorum]KAH4477229.1 hypothetical protein HBH90_006250 [Parastagonospora nodorum]KAH4536570.1 hypothetical protein HBH87_004870 [Parastagonospora nodorum]